MQVHASISAQSFPAYNATKRQTADSTRPSGNAETDAEKSGKSKAGPATQQLDEQQKQEVRDLQKRDREVRAHEAAHKSAAGNLANGGASFSYQRGPDGRLYAVGGEVSIDTAPVSGDPQATLQKANQIRAAALAPAQPSSQDRAVAAQAALMATEARNDIAAERREEPQQTAGTTETGNQNRNNHTAAQQYLNIANSNKDTADGSALNLIA